MIVTEDFVIILFPKTGTTFVRDVFWEIYRKRDNSKILSRIRRKLGLRNREYQIIKTERNNKLSVHGNVKNIPNEHQHKSIISIARGPFTRLMSRFTYQSWIRKPGKFGLKAQEHFEKYPYLSLEDFVRYQQWVLKYKYADNVDVQRLIEKESIGLMTAQFIEFYFYEPQKVFKHLSEDYISSKAYLQDMAPVKFLRQEHLSDDLYKLLEAGSYDTGELAFIKNKEHSNVSQFDQDRGHSMWSDTSREFVLKTERFLFEIFADLGLDYRNDS